jgi:hypothetical protein
MLPRAPPTPVPPLARAVVLPPSVRPPLQKQLASRSPAPRAPKPRMAPPPHGERLHRLARRGHHPRDSWRRPLRPNCSGRLCQWSSNISTHLALRPDPRPAHAPTGSPGPAPRMVSSTPILPTTLHVGRRRRHPSHQWHPRRLGRLRRWSPIVPAHRARRSVPRVINGSARAQRRPDRTTPLQHFQGRRHHSAARGRPGHSSFASPLAPLRLLRVQVVRATPRQRVGDKEAHIIAAARSTSSLLNTTTSFSASRPSLLSAAASYTSSVPASSPTLELEVAASSYSPTLFTWDPR